MRTKRLAALAITICLLLTTGLSPVHAAATLSETGQIQAPKSDIREVIADNAALVAEVATVKQSLTAERQSTAELIRELNRYMTSSDEEKRLLREQNAILGQMNDVLQKQVRTEKRKGIGKIVIGLLVGGAIGVAVGK